MAELTYASNGKGNLGVTLGAVGTGLGLLGGNILGNGLGGIFGNRPICSGDELVTRYDAEKDARISALETEKSLLEAEKKVDQKSLEIYTYFDTWRRKYEADTSAAFTQQAVYNATNTANINNMQGQIAQLYGMTKLVIPGTNVCPEPMSKYNSWAAPTTSTT